MRQIFIIALLVFAVQSCGEPNVSTENKDSLTASTNNTVRVDTIKQPFKKDTPVLIPKADTVSHRGGTINEKILGIWALVGDENASFDIQKNKIVYPELSKSYKYKIVDDSLRIKYEDYEAAFFIKMKGNDTLVLTGDEEQTYKRFKQ